MNNYCRVLHTVNDHDLSCSIYLNTDQQTYNYQMICVSGEVFAQRENLTFEECFLAINEQLLADAVCHLDRANNNEVA